MSFLVHAGGEVVTEQDVFNVPVPQVTNRHYPVPHSYLVGTVKDVFSHMFPQFPLVKEQYALGKVDRKTGIPGQMFGLYTYDTGNPKFGLAIGFRNSYDKSLAAGVVGGANPFVCDNLCFSGDSFAIHRKNTKEAINDLYRMVMDNAYSMLEDYRHMINQFDCLEAIQVDQDRGYEVLGLMQGHDIIKPRQFQAAVQAWREPPQEEWEPRNALSLYNAVTEATKKTNVQDVIEDLSRPHRFLIEHYNVEAINKQLEEVC